MIRFNAVNATSIFMLVEFLFVENYLKTTVLRLLLVIIYPYRCAVLMLSGMGLLQSLHESNMRFKDENLAS